MEGERHSRGLDGDAALLLILSRVGETGLPRAGTSDDTGLGNQRVRQGGFAMVNVRDNGHVSDVGLLVHDLTDLVYGKVYLGREGVEPTGLAIILMI